MSTETLTLQTLLKSRNHHKQMADNLQYCNRSCKFTTTYSGAIMHSFEPVAHSSSHSPLSYYNPANCSHCFLMMCNMNIAPHEMERCKLETNPKTKI